MRILVDDCRIDGERGAAVVDTETGAVDREDLGADAYALAVLLPPLTDSHVHLGLASPDALAATQLSHVVDLGWTADAAAGWRGTRDGFTVDVVGRFHATVGGYPSQQAWAAPSITAELTSAADAAEAVHSAVALGAAMLKVTLNADAGPVLSDSLLSALVGSAKQAGLSVVAHTEGSGQAERALSAGCDVLAHTPWTERLSDALIAAMAPRMAWISTLDIHGWGDYGADHARAQDNLRRFHAAGGRVVYGTDLGNGPLPVGLNVRELDALAGAGLDSDAILSSLVGLVPAPQADFALVVGTVPADASDLAAWLVTAERSSLRSLAVRYA